MCGNLAYRHIEKPEFPQTYGMPPRPVGSVSYQMLSLIKIVWLVSMNTVCGSCWKKLVTIW